jgi:hypothetical protein
MGQLLSGGGDYKQYNLGIVGGYVSCPFDRQWALIKEIEVSI